MADRARPGAPLEDIEDRDPGLADERTQLAWTRTAISFVAVAAAILKSDPAAGVVVLVLSTAVWGLGRLAARESDRSRRPLGLTPRRTLQLITAASTVVSLTAMAIALLSPGHPIR
jgi:uncharacterized membrane protein YidH (DUF202 family)